ncbi:MAG: hypothetical protein ABH868_06670 [bacterium]
MKPSRHVIVSLGVGAVLSLWLNNMYLWVICLLSGVLVDVDHILEYMMEYGWRDFTFWKCYKTSESRKFKKMHLVLHSSELFLLLWFFVVYTRNIYLLAATLGYSFHLGLDAIGNRIGVRSYSLLWRAINRFSADKFLGR